MDMRSARAGFTLIEIVSVLVILGVLAAVAVPKYFDLQEESEKKAAFSAVAEAQARIQLSFGQQILQGKTCEDAVGEVNDIKNLSDDGAGAFGEFLLTAETITTAGTAVSAQRGKDGKVFETGAKLYLPSCDEDDKGISKNFPKDVLGYLDRVLAEDSHAFRDHVKGKKVDLGNGVSYTIENIVNQGGKSAYVNFVYANANGDTLTFHVYKNSEGASWIEQMVVQPTDGSGITLVKDVYRSNLKDTEINKAKSIVSSMGLNTSSFGSAFDANLGAGILDFDKGFIPKS